MSEVVRQVGRSTFNRRESNFLWKIPSFSRVKYRLLDNEWRVFDKTTGERKSSIESPVFSASSGDIELYLVMEKVGDRNNGQVPCVGFILKSKNSKERLFEVEINYSITILNNASFTVSKRLLINSNTTTFYPGVLMPELNAFQLFDKTVMNLENDELQILLKYEVSDLNVNNQVVTFERHDPKSRISILDGFEKQWEDQKYCDFELIAPCGRKIRAHKFFLSTRSPVFSTMLESNMKEKQENSVKIEDISYEALKEMLRFMYSGKVKKLDHKIVVDLLSAAEKYEIQELKEICKEFLAFNLTSEHALLTLKLCKTYNLADIQKEVDDFVRSNAKLIFFNKVLQKPNDEIDVYVKLMQEMALKDA